MPAEAKDPALVLETGAAGPGTHVLIIGIGTYDCLLDGVHENLQLAEGMEQLDAPPYSAKALADWFLDGNFHNDVQPLASVAMVVSAPVPFLYDHPKSQHDTSPLPDGSIETVLAAIRCWEQRAATDRRNLTIFYFCGHGVFSGSQILLCRDYGVDAGDRFDRTLNFSKLCTAMMTRPPEYQIFLADACRTPDAVVDLLLPLSSVGRGALTPFRLIERGGTPARQSIHLASSDLAPSYGRFDGVSVYADALIRALAGGGAQTDLGMWVGTDGLQCALGTYTVRLARGEGVEQEPDRIKSARFKVHKPAKIEVPVYLTCDPAEAWASPFTVTTQRNGGDLKSIAHDPTVTPDQTELEITLEHDKYDFAATFGEDSPFIGGKGSLIVHPPETPLCLPIDRRIA